MGQIKKNPLKIIRKSNFTKPKQREILAQLNKNLTKNCKNKLKP